MRTYLEFLLIEGFGTAYEHHSELAPSETMFAAHRRKGSGDWAAYEAACLLLLAAPGADAVGRGLLARCQAPCLLCSEPSDEHCHRRLIAEYWARQIPDLAIIHL